MNNLNIDFDKVDGLIPAIIQDEVTGAVLMLGYMNQEALDMTISTQKVTFYSRTKGRLWTKGETSGNFLMLKSIKLDCDNDTLLVRVNPVGPVCHKGDDTCWAENNSSKTLFIDKLRDIIKDRKNNPIEKSYTASLFAKGINKIAQKVGEEAVEIVIEAKDDNKDLFLGEAADLLFHYLILLEAKEIELDEVMEVLIKRHKGN
ncbi:bifunctional phosphoribosyl-AMP cyclohydrolase/phosphoribosyl-ATP diphosphatase HisIE [Aquiflexum gelatinilyticum]|uniref:bifunctional phosphoribosyl-AMP cyclohydrolase/phosphoribosyl-ATP diphosphatase HisIE n=1 Tax=Aquiflexum gelatinilyticum TaxID=2961943 RepID=UPI00216A3176|nr:bifunctional phosphoribosyl-AMP cyclohydrolase/phosphoribosyl-ATP diphosphatase HisIE [Aquiflexum gelatinilyticum]MCS4433605.1 bifunctional phosphoribosyl-AMP cyclohydrolase/phosphoribosyl-ATP diphosphatase HisIE [Aquiflexum gelatinilyticum]